MCLYLAGTITQCLLNGVVCLTINKVGCDKLKVEKSCFMQKATFSLAEYLRPFLELKENKFDIFAKLFIQALLYLFKSTD